MPIVIELLVLLLIAYALGLALGWGIWRQRDRVSQEDAK